MPRSFQLVLVLLLGVLSPAIVVFNPVAAVSGLPPGFREEPPITGIARPIAFDWAPDGRLFVGQEDGKLRVVKDGIVQSTPALQLDVETDSEKGLLGVAVDPRFAAGQPYIYLYYSPSSTGKNRVSRFTISSDTARNEQILIDRIPAERGNHNAGDLHFGRDGMLYVSTGDGGDYRNNHSQNLDSLGGKILRIDPQTGRGLADNPFYSAGASEARKRVWAYGFRNPFRFAFQPGTGKMYIADVGSAAYEEINEGRKGANYGWPRDEGPTKVRDWKIGSTVEYPIFWYRHDESGAFKGCGSVIGGTFVPAGSTFPSEYHGDYIFADYVCPKLFLLQSGSRPTASPFAHLDESYAAPVHLAFGPDGLLYVSDYSRNQLRRFRGGSSTNRQPNAVANADPTTGPLPLAVKFSGAGSSDPDGDTLTYSWTFGDGGSATGRDVSHTYKSKGAYTAILTVSDRRGASDTASVTVWPGNTAPQAKITSPPNGTVYRAGANIELRGTASDADGDSLSLTWEAVRHHGTSHTHPWASGSGTSLETTMPPPEDQQTACTSKLEVRFTATDRFGASAQAIVYFYPVCARTYLPMVRR